MLVESAFSILPELVAGRGFMSVTKEANAVGLFYSALLNTLHSKNVPDPIRFIQLEYPYSTKKVPLPSNKIQKRRDCDLYCSYGGSRIGSHRLEKYGWRYNNYVEAKFFKSYEKTIQKNGQDSNASKYSRVLISSLIRLVALVPEPELIAKNNAKTSSARYLLLIANQPFNRYINKFLGTNVEQFFNNPQSKFEWEINLTEGRLKKMAMAIGKDFDRLKLDLTISCYAYLPIVKETEIDKLDNIWMMLLRIDKGKITLANAPDQAKDEFEFMEDRSIVQSSVNSYNNIREFVFKNSNNI